MVSEYQNTPEKAELITQQETALARLAENRSLVLAEIISRSLAHIQTSKELVVTERRAGEEREFDIAPGVSIVMCWIPPGEFLMGSPEDEDGREKGERQHLVKITRGFWLAKTHVTQVQWQAVMGALPSR